MGIRAAGHKDWIVAAPAAMDSQEPRTLAGGRCAIRETSKHRSQLSRAEIAELIGYCDKMLQIGIAKKGRRMWIELRLEYEALLIE